MTATRLIIIRRRISTELANYGQWLCNVTSSVWSNRRDDEITTTQLLATAKEKRPSAVNEFFKYRSTAMHPSFVTARCTKRGLAIACRQSVRLFVTSVDHDHIGWKLWKLREQLAQHLGSS